MPSPLIQRLTCLPACLLALSLLGSIASAAPRDVDFNTDVRPILSNKCFACHGPDQERVEAGLRLDDPATALSELESGNHAIIPGQPDASELMARVSSDDDDVRMPPAEFGKPLTQPEIETLRAWIAQGAKFATHWSYVKPARPAVPDVPAEFHDWPRNSIDNFTLRRMLEHGLRPSSEAERHVLARRVFLDLTGLPPTPEEVEAFVHDADPLAYEHLVDDLLRRPSYGEHWARKWLDLARYADSAGYADDPPRTIWAYRDWVIRAINQNMPFDQFTVEQLAGDLLPSPTSDQLIATAFHRNTLTNNEGGTQDEEFRNVAVVDRVNTTMAVWMGTTMACAQCHSHKYDPLSQEEYFRLFAILNSTADRDTRNEAPTIPVYTEEQKHQRQMLAGKIKQLQSVFQATPPELDAEQTRWEQSLSRESNWTVLRPKTVDRKSGMDAQQQPDGSVLVTKPAETDTYTLELPISEPQTIAALRLETLPHASLAAGGSGLGGGNFVITGISARLRPREWHSPAARFVRITNRGKAKILSLAEVQVLSNGKNISPRGKASQHSTAYAGPPELAIDGNTNGDFTGKSVTHTETVDDPWWELDLGSAVPIDSVVVWNRTDNNLQSRLKNFTIELLDADRQPVWTTTIQPAPNPSVQVAPDNTRDVQIQTAFADYEQPNFAAAEALKFKSGQTDGWAVGGQIDKPHHLTLVPARPIRLTQPSVLELTIAQQSPHKNHLLGHFRIAMTGDENALAKARLSPKLAGIMEKPRSQRTAAETAELAAFFRRHIAASLVEPRQQLAKLEQALAAIKPATTVPVMQELPKPRITRLQHRGSYLDTGQVVTPGTPAAFHRPPDGPLNRLALAKWLVDENNPLTARVVSNRYWEAIFGTGIVATSEDFGSQGDPPTHPELLDWLATELVENGWDTRHLLRLVVTSATYRQSSRLDPQLASADPDNRWLARGPRVRLTAEMVRDQALAVSGLLSHRMFGAPVRPPQPNMGLTAAFGGSTDWKTSAGEDRYRRAIYTTWRRSNPYPSMATFDAPNREVCVIRRNRTNTPLQSLVTLNDPVYVEAAQSLARMALMQPGEPADQIRFVFRRCTSRSPTPDELHLLTALFADSRSALRPNPGDALKLATDPLGPLPDKLDAVDAAAMTVVANVLLNLDEMFLKR